SPDWAKEAGTKALTDAGIADDEVEQAFAGYVYGDSCYGQRAVYELGLPGIPVVNVNNNCSTGSSALFLARQAIKGELADCVLAIGFEKMQRGSIKMNFQDRAGAMDRHSERMALLRAPEQSPLAPQMFGNAGRAMTTDMSSSFDDTTDCMKIVGYDMSREAARRAYEEAQVAPEDVDVIELHDCFSANELITYEALGLAAEGEGHKLVEAKATTYGGSGPVVNPSGGLISKGHPLGATGLAQCSELCWQLRGVAEARQVAQVDVALHHN